MVTMCQFVKAFLLMLFMIEVSSLTCFRCNSTDPDGECRMGNRGKGTRKRQVCRQPTATCFAIATVNEYGSPYFQRGCTTEEVCKERTDTEIEFCSTCKFLHCNYDVMVLDKEVEDYLNEARNYNFSIQAKKTTPMSAPTTTAATTPPVKDDLSKGVISILQELMAKSEGAKKSAGDLVDEVLSDYIPKFGEKLSVKNVVVRDGATAKKNVEFKDKLNNFGNFEMDESMYEPKPVSKRNLL